MIPAQFDSPGRESLDPPAAEFVLDVPSDLQVIERVVSELVDRCREFDFEGSRLNLNFRVGITEALANAMLYGNQRDPRRQVRLEVSMDPYRVAISVIDQGNGFDPDKVPDPTLPSNLERAGGRGVFLIRKLMDEVEYNERGNAVRLVLYRDRSVRRSTPT